jgi:hypothetical protein
MLQGSLVQAFENEASSPCHEVPKHLGHLVPHMSHVNAYLPAALDFFLLKDWIMVQKHDLPNYVARDA